MEWTLERRMEVAKAMALRHRLEEPGGAEWRRLEMLLTEADEFLEANSKSFSCELSLVESARRFQKPGGEFGEGEGEKVKMGNDHGNPYLLFRVALSHSKFRLIGCINRVTQFIPGELHIRFTPAKNRQVWDKTLGKCYYCGRQTYDSDFLTEYIENKTNCRMIWDLEFTVDHILPRCKGGSNTLVNKVSCCRFCNNYKGLKTLEEFREWVSRTLYNVPSFTSEQIEYLNKNHLYLPCYPPIVFWFEEKEAGILGREGDNDELQ